MQSYKNEGFFFSNQTVAFTRPLKSGYEKRLNMSRNSVEATDLVQFVSIYLVDGARLLKPVRPTLWS